MAAPSQTWKGARYVAAGGLTAAVAMSFAYAVPWVANGGDCSEESAYFCLWFIVILVSAPITAFYLTLVLHLNRLRRKPLPHGILVIVPFSAILTQTLVSAFFVWVMWPPRSYRPLSEILLVPQGLVAGILVGVVYCVLLRLLTRRQQESA